MSKPVVSFSKKPWSSFLVGETLLMEVFQHGIQEHRVLKILGESKGLLSIEVRNLYTLESYVHDAHPDDEYFKVECASGTRKIITEKQLKFRLDEKE